MLWTWKRVFMQKLDSKREGKQLLTDVLGRCANNRFLEEYKVGANLSAE